jgi:ribonucleoside-diphosphate reductase alpha chain
VDYIFRWLGSRFLPADEKGALGLIDRSAVVADAPVAFGASALRPRADEGITAQSEAVSAPVEPPVAPAPPASEGAPRASAPAATSAAPSISAPVDKRELVTVATNGAAHGSASASSNGNGKRTLESVTGSLGGGVKVAFAAQADAPSCAECGSIMIRNGSCYKCLNCGSTSGCS